MYNTRSLKEAMTKGNHPKSEGIKFEHCVSSSETVFKEDIGRFVTINDNKIVDDREKFNGLRVNDFSLDNMINCGAIANLKPMTMSGSSLVDADNLEVQLANISAVADSE